jgi:hypothetical protein
MSWTVSRFTVSKLAVSKIKENNVLSNEEKKLIGKITGNPYFRWIPFLENSGKKKSPRRNTPDLRFPRRPSYRSPGRA